MGPDPILCRHLEDQKLKLGQLVIAHWKGWQGRFSIRARVVALKARSVQVELQRAAGDYPVGHRLELPRICDSERWSKDRGVSIDRAI